MSRVMVSIADDLLARIDAEATRREVSRTVLLAAVERSERRFASSGSFESDLTRSERDAHP